MPLGLLFSPFSPPLFALFLYFSSSFSQNGLFRKVQNLEVPDSHSTNFTATQLFFQQIHIENSLNVYPFVSQFILYCYNHTGCHRLGVHTFIQLMVLEAEKSKNIVSASCKGLHSVSSYGRGGRAREHMRVQERKKARFILLPETHSLKS